MSVREIERLINSLPNKTSYGHDKVSNTLLKFLCTSISYPLQIIFNQSIYQGGFPDKIKIAEIVPLYKGKEQDLVVNYRPMSLLMTISKILEKIVYRCFYSFYSFFMSSRLTSIILIVVVIISIIIIVLVFLYLY